MRPRNWQLRRMALLPCRFCMSAAADWPALAGAIEGRRAVRLAGGRRAEGARLAGVTTHVLDVTSGRPAAGRPGGALRVGGGSERKLIADVVTNADGRTDKPLMSADQARAGRFELIFHAGDYFRGRRAELADPPFLDIIPIRFGVADPQAHYHVPLLVSPVELFDLSRKLRRRPRRTHQFRGAPSCTRAVCLMDGSIRLGFLGASPFRCESPRL